MLITFKSKAAAEVVMYKEHAKRILDLFDKDVERGIFTAAEMAHAVTLLQQKIAEDRAHTAAEEIQRDIDAHHNEQGDDNGHEQAQPVSFSTRAYPLLEMLRAAQADGQNVMWGP